MKETPPASGARESNAGDDFHNLWACQQTLPLLQPASGLTLVKVEELAREDLAGVGEEEDWFLAADLTEYFGGRSFAAATRVVVSQLKHSTRHPGRAWTIGRLTSRYKGDKTLAGELASMLTGYLQQAAAAQVVAKLRIRLVSNQPIDPGLQRWLGTIGQALAAGAADLAAIRAVLSPADTADLARVHAAAGLPEVDFILFLRVLDLSACGATDRSLLRVELQQKLGASVQHATDAFRDLYVLIHRETMPEARNSLGIDRDVLVACLGAGDYDSLFPVPARFTAVPDPIPTSEVDDLLGRITDRATRHLIVYGDAGVGKTTTLQRVMERLPPNSLGVFYDCYGGGSYMDAGGQRHLHRRALVQIANELAVASGHPLVVKPPDNVPDLERCLATHIEAAAKLAAKSGALLVIAIDAADNAVDAAHGDRDCFVPGLWRQALPPNVRLVMSARRHRRQRLGAPPGTPEFPLAGFDQAASSTALRRHYASASDDEATWFHTRSRGNPRIQFYSLNQAKSVEHAVHEAAKTPDDLFLELLNQAEALAAPGFHPRHSLAVLLRLTRPVPLTVLAEICSQPPAWAASYCEALAPGAIIEQDHVTFRDEDFETYLRQQVSPAQEAAAEKAIAATFLRQSATSAYAARTLAEHLFRAGDRATLEAVALDFSAPLPVPGQLERVDLQQRRIGWALKAAGKGGDDASAVRLLIAAAELARTDGALTAIVRRNPGLAARFGEPEHVRRLILRERHRSWQGPAHWRLALLYARNPATRQKTEEHLGLANGWLRRRQAIPPEERRGWDVKPQDLAVAIAAMFWIKGAVAAANDLRRWHPVKFRFEAALALADHLAPALTPAELHDALAATEATPLVAAAFFAAAARAGRAPASQDIRRTLEELVARRSTIPKYFPLAAPSLIEFLELAAGRPGLSQLVRRLLSALPWKYQRSGPGDHLSIREHDIAIRAWSLRRALVGRSATALELLPAHYLGRGAKKYREQRDRAETSFTAVLDSYNLTAKVIAGRARQPSVQAAVTAYLEGVRKKTEQSWEKEDWYYRDNARRCAEAVLTWPASAGPTIIALAEPAEITLKAGAPDLWLDLARLALRQPATVGLGWELLERAATFWESRPLSASDRWHSLLKCSEGAEKHDATQAQNYYARALKAAEGIDDDNIHLLGLHNWLAKASAGSPGAVSHAPRLARTVEEHRDLVSDGDNLPWAATAEAVSALDLSQGLALASRWDDQHDLQIVHGLPGITKGAVTAGTLPPLVAVHLLGFTDTDEYLPRAICCLDALHQGGSGSTIELHQALGLVSHRIRLHFAPRDRARAAHQVLTWAKDRGMESVPGVPELAALAAFLEKLPTPARAKGSEPQFRPKRPAVRRPAQPRTIAQALRQIQSVWTSTRERDDVLTAVAGASQIASPSDRLKLLAGLGTIDFGFYGRSVEVQAIASFLERWRHDAAVIGWFRTEAPAVAVRLLRPDPHGGPPDSTGLSVFCRLVREHLGSGVAVLGEILSAELPRLGAEELYRTARILSEGLESTATAQALDWSLTRLEQRLLPRAPAPPLTLNLPTALARFLFALMGHPKYATRWTTLHVARGLVRDFSALLPALVAHLDTVSVGPFRAPRYEFFWMSARVSLLQLLLRLAHDHPEWVKPHAAAISRHALGPFPHALIRELSRQTCLHLAAQFRRLFTPKVLRDLKVANSPRRRVKPPKNHVPRFRDKWANAGGKTRFHFNSIDTIPYWFEPAAGLWGLTAADLAQAADRWICDEWKRTKHDWKDDRREMRDKFNWTRTHNDHGRIPEVELTTLYLEYHSMMCAAGEFVTSKPLVDERYADTPKDYCRWKNWLDRWLGDFPELWYVDWRGPVPLRNAYWDDSLAPEAWLTAVNDATFDDVLGLTVTDRPGQIVVDATTRFASRGRRETVYLSGGLVTPKSAPALLRAFQIIEDPSDYGLPHEAGGHDNRNVDAPGFHLSPWLLDRQADRGIQDHDPASKGISSYRHIPVDPFIRHFKLAAPQQTAWLDPKGTTVLEEQIWEDGVGETEHYNTISDGRLVWVRLAHLRRFLHAAGRSLILKITIERRLERGQQEPQDHKNECRKARLYLYTAEGRLLTVDSSRQIG